ncbi:MAG: hypothetical protein ABIR96_10655 [Bdellovibrionota bacterium]
MPITKLGLKSALDQVERVGRVAIFPEKNKKKNSIVSLWEIFYPRTKMKWEWDEAADNRVVKLWWLKNEIAQTQKVLYGRFFGNRPVLVSKKEALKILVTLEPRRHSRLASEILSRLEDNSPQTKRMLGRALRDDGWEPTKSEFEKALLDLQRDFKIVNLGDSEREKGPMPSTEYATLALIFPDVAATRV